VILRSKTAGSSPCERTVTQALGTDSWPTHWESSVDLPYPAGPTSVTIRADPAALIRRSRSDRKTAPAVPTSPGWSDACVRSSMVASCVSRTRLAPPRESKASPRRYRPSSQARPSRKLDKMPFHPVRAMPQHLSGGLMGGDIQIGCRLGLQGGRNGHWPRTTRRTRVRAPRLHR